MSVKAPLLPAHLVPYARTMAARRIMRPISDAATAALLESVRNEAAASAVLRGEDPAANVAAQSASNVDPFSAGAPQSFAQSGSESSGAMGLVSAVNGVGGPFTIAAAEAVLVLSGNQSRQLLVISNLGTALAYILFDNPTASVLGIPLVGGATLFLDVKVPTNPISAYSPLGTALYAYEG